MEVEEDYDSSQNNFCFPDNSTNPETTEALHAETIREDPAPSTSRMVVPMASRNFRINKTKAAKKKLDSGFKPRRRKAMGRRTSASTALQEDGPEFRDIEDLPVARAAASSSPGHWRAREMATIEEETALPVRPFKCLDSCGAPPSAAERRMAKFEVMREESSGNTRHLDRILAALRVNVQRMQAMSRDNPDALRDTLPDETIALMRKCHL